MEGMQTAIYPPCISQVGLTHPLPTCALHPGDPVCPQCSMWIFMETIHVVKEGIHLEGASTGLAACVRRWPSFQHLLRGEETATTRGTSQCYILCTFPSFTHRKATALRLHLGSRLTENLCLPTYKQGSWDHESKYIQSILHDPDTLKAPYI